MNRDKQSTPDYQDRFYVGSYLEELGVHQLAAGPFPLTVQDFQVINAAAKLLQSERGHIDLSSYVNAAHISGADTPHVVVQKLQLAMNAAPQSPETEPAASHPGRSPAVAAPDISSDKQDALRIAQEVIAEADDKNLSSRLWPVDSEMVTVCRALLAQSARVEIPIELFDGMSVYTMLTNQELTNMTPKHVSTVLDAVVRLIRKNKSRYVGEKK